MTEQNKSPQSEAEPSKPFRTKRYRPRISFSCPKEHKKCMERRAREDLEDQEAERLAAESEKATSTNGVERPFETQNTESTASGDEGAEASTEEGSPKKKRFKLSTLFWLTWSFLTVAKAFGMLGGRDFFTKLLLTGIVNAMICGVIIGIYWICRTINDNA